MRKMKKMNKLLASVLCMCMVINSGILPVGTQVSYAQTKSAAGISDGGIVDYTPDIMRGKFLNGARDIASTGNASSDIASNSDADRAEKGVIIDFIGYVDDETPLDVISLEEETEREDIPFPETIEVLVEGEEGEEEFSLPVTWTEEGNVYDAALRESVDFIPEWDRKRYPLAEGYNPRIFITVQMGGYPSLDLLYGGEDFATSFLFADESIEEVEETLGREVNAAHESKSSFRNLFGLLAQNDYRFSDYYILYENSLATEKSDTTQNLLGNCEEVTQKLKYQIDFHNDVDYETGDVEIKVPSVLYQDRYGEDVVFSDIGVPKAPGKSKASSFNYEIVEEGGKEYILLSNCKPIIAGSNNFMQIFYSLDDMATVDGTTWEIIPQFTIKGEQGDGIPLVGSMDTEVTLTETSKHGYTVSNKLIYPELYTESQVRDALEGIELPAEYVTGFDNYKFFLWETKLNGYASQPWNLVVVDTPSHGGVVLGQYLKDKNLDGEYSKTQGDTLRWENQARYGLGSLRYGDEKNKEVYLYTVTAYPNDQFPADKKVENTIKATLVGVDDNISRELESTAEWTWEPYEWTYTGDIIGVKKYFRGKESDLEESWLAVYKDNRNSGKDTVIPGMWHVGGEMYGYDLIYPEIGDTGERKDLSATENYMLGTVDDIQYITNHVGGYRELGPEDYYYNSIEIEITDKTIDIYEDMASVNQDGEDTTVWAMTREKPDEWVELGSVGYDEMRNGYQVPEEWLSKEIYRIKTEHKSNDYATFCNIYGTTALRHDSELIRELLEAEGVTKTTIQNLGGVYGTSTVMAGWIQDTDETQYDQYGSLGLLEKTKDLYNTVLMRDNAFAVLTDLQEENGILKTGSARNDALNSQVDVTYQLTAWDGYRMYEQEASSKLDLLGLTPSRDSGVFYDLLPAGISFDPTAPVKAGKVTYLNRSQNAAKSWDGEGVSVEYHVTDDYKGSGRQMVTFEISDDGGDNARIWYDSDQENYQWFCGWGIEFGAYYPWENTDLGNGAVNVAAYQVPGDTLKGTAYPDNGDHAPEAAGGYFDDLDGDGDTGEMNVIYGTRAVSLDSAMAAHADITKAVKEDADVFGTADTDARVELNKNYTYYLTLTNSNNTLKDLVIFDNLEYAAVNRAAEEPGRFEDDWWYGEYVGTHVGTLEEKGIDVRIYYSADREEKIQEGGKTGTEILASGSWVEAGNWNRPMSDVKSVAYDLSRNTDGNAFELKEMESLMLTISMKAPDGLQGAKEYAYNNPAYYGTVTASDGTTSADTVIGDSTSVKLYGDTKLTVEKKPLKGMGAPEEETFTFKVKVGGKAYAYREYKLYDKTADSEIEKTGIHATDREGILYLKQNQRAEFAQVPSGEAYEVTEEENLRWESSAENADGILKAGQVNEAVFENTYHPVLFFEKKIENRQPYTDPEDQFIFELTLNGVSAANMEYYVVDPSVDMKKKPVVLDKYKTDGNGRFTIKAGQRVCFRTTAGDTYRVEEVDGFGDGTDYTCQFPETEGTVEGTYAFATITNTYLWKQLIVSKDVVTKEGGTPDENQEFTFHLEIAGNPYGNQAYTLVDKDGAEDGNAHSTGADGTFLLKHGQKARFEKIKSGTPYKVMEEENPLYTILSPEGGSTSGTLPVYADSSKVEFKNQSRLRDLEVSKKVVCDKSQTEVASKQEFTYTIKVEGVLYGDKPYEKTGVDGTVSAVQTGAGGTFTLKGGEKAVFQDIPEGSTYEITETPESGYIQGIPEDGKPAVGTIGAELKPEKAEFVNHTKAGLQVSKIVLPENVTTPLTEENKAVEFRFKLLIGDKALGNREFVRTLADGSIADDLTDSEGRFRLKHGEYAQFSELPMGEVYSVTELGVDDFIQVKPADGKPASGILELDTKAAFENQVSPGAEGGSDPLIIEKKLVAGNGVAQEYIDQVLEGFYATETDVKYNTDYYEWRSVLTSAIVIEVGGIPYEGPYEIFTPDGRTKKYTKTESGEGKRAILLFPGEKAVITGLKKGTPYSLYEAYSGYSESPEYGENYYIMNQVLPENLEGIKGFIKDEDNLEMFVNELNVNEINPFIRIAKMVDGENLYKLKASEHPEYIGKKLTLQLLKRGDGGDWIPAQGIKYCPLASESGTAEDTSNLYKPKFTGYDGKIVLTGESSDDYSNRIMGLYCTIDIQFMDFDKNYKLIEVAEETDPVFGEFLEFSGAGNSAQYVQFKMMNSTAPDTSFKVYKKVISSDEQKKNIPYSFSLSKRQLYGWTSKVINIPEANYPYRVFETSKEDGADKEIKKGGPFITDEEGGFTLKDGQYALFEGAQPMETSRFGEFLGTAYQVTENAPDGFKTIVESIGDEVTSENLTRYPALGSNEAMLAPGHTEGLVFTNSYDPTPSLTVRKLVTCEQGMYLPESNRTFTFTLSVDGKAYGNEEYKLYSLDGTELKNKTEANGVQVEIPWETDEYGEFKLTNEQYAVFDWLGAGKKYEIVESPLEGYTQVSPAAGTAASGVMTSEGKTETFINHYGVAKGTITVRKTLSFPVGLPTPDETFHFQLEVEGQEYALKEYKVYEGASILVGGKNYTDAMGEFTLKAGQYAVFENIPIGVDYEVKEILPGNTDYRLISSTGAAGATAASGVKAEFVNGIASFMVTKTVTGAYSQEAPADDSFEFIATTNGTPLADREYWLYEDSGKQIAGTHKTDSAGIFRLEAGQKALFYGLPEGTPYEVREKSKTHYTQIVPTGGNSYTGITGDTVDVLAFENKYAKSAVLNVRKEVERSFTTAVPGTDLFTFCLTVNGRAYAGKYYTLDDDSRQLKTDAEGKFRIKNGATAHFGNLLDGDQYRIEETAMPEGYTGLETVFEGTLDGNAETSVTGKNKVIPTVWVENTTGDSTADDTADDNKGGKVSVSGEAGSSSAVSSDGNDDNSQGRYPKKTVTGVPYAGWFADIDGIVIGLRGTGGSGAVKKISELPRVTVNPSDGSDFYNMAAGEFQYTQKDADGTNHVLRGQITKDAAGAVSVALRDMTYDIDVGIPFVEYAYPTITKTSDTDETVDQGEIITYKLTVINTEPTEREITVEDVIPNQVTAGTYKVEINGISQTVTGNWPGSWKGTIPAATGVDDATVVITITGTVAGSYDKTDADANIIRNQAVLKMTPGGGDEVETPSEEVYHYLTPSPEYTMKKTRVTDPTIDFEGTKGFLAGDGTEITYQAELENTGDTDLRIALKDVFAEEENFEFVDYRIGETGDKKTYIAGTDIDVEVAAGTTVQVFFTAKVKDKTPAKLTEGGYLNTVTSTAEYDWTEKKPNPGYDPSVPEGVGNEKYTETSHTDVPYTETKDPDGIPGSGDEVTETEKTSEARTPVIPTIWVENTTGDDTPADTTDDNKGGKVAVSGKAESSSTISSDGADNNSKGRYPKNAVTGTPDTGWTVDKGNITIGLRGKDSSGATQKVGELTNVTVNPTDGSDFYNTDSGEFQYTVKDGAGANHVLKGQITRDNTGVVTVAFDEMMEDLDVGIPFKEYGYPGITKTSDTDGETVDERDTITYKLTVTNTEPIARGITVEDDIPDQVAAGTYQVEINGTEQTVTGTWPGSWTGTIPAADEKDATVVITITGTVTKGYDGTDADANIIRNQAVLKVTPSGGGDEIETPTGNVYHYLAPSPGYTLRKSRVTEPSIDFNGTKGFLAGDGTEITYQAELDNTGDTDLTIKLKDVFAEEENFEFVDYRIGESGEKKAYTNGTGIEVTVAAGAAEKIFFTAKVKDRTPAKLTEGGYLNTITTTATYDWTEKKPNPDYNPSAPEGAGNEKYTETLHTDVPYIETKDPDGIPGSGDETTETEKTSEARTPVIPTIWVENTTGDDTAADTTDDNKGGKVAVNGEAGSSSTISSDGADDNSKGRYPKNTVTGTPDAGWTVDKGNITIGLRGKDSSGAVQKIGELTNVTVNPSDGSDFYNTGTGEFQYTAKDEAGADYVLKGQIAEKSGGVTEVLLKDMLDDLDVGIPFKEYGYPTITKTSDTDGEAVDQGDTITYKLTVTNTEPIAREITVEDTIPNQVTAGTYQVEINGVAQNITGTWQGSWSGTIPAADADDATVVITITGRVTNGYDKTDANANVIRNQAVLKVTPSGGGTEIETPTEEVYHYLTPSPEYTMKKTRVTEATEDFNGAKGFLAGDGTEITYQAELQNTGNTDLRISLNDVFAEEENFEFVDYRIGEAGDKKVYTAGTDIKVDLTAGATVKVLFTAKVKDGTPAKLTEGGYLNTVTSTAVYDWTEKKPNPAYDPSIPEGAGNEKYTEISHTDVKYTETADPDGVPGSGDETIETEKTSEARTPVIPTIWVENTTGDSTPNHAADDNKGGKIAVSGEAGSSSTVSSDGADDNSRGRYTKSAVTGTPDEGWRVDKKNITIGLRGKDSSGAIQKIGELTNVTVNPSDGSDFYNPETGEFRYTARDASGTDHVLKGRITEKSDGTMTVAFQDMMDDIDVGIPFVKTGKLMIDNRTENASDITKTNAGGYVTESIRTNADLCGYEWMETVVSWRPDKTGAWGHSQKFVIKAYSTESEIAAGTPTASAEIDILDEHGELRKEEDIEKDVQRHYPEAEVRINQKSGEITLVIPEAADGEKTYATEVNVWFIPSLWAENTTNEDVGGTVEIGDGKNPADGVETGDHTGGRDPEKSTVTARPDKGYEVDKDNLTIRDYQGNYIKIVPDEEGSFQVELPIQVDGRQESVTVTGTVVYSTDGTLTITLNKLLSSTDIGISFKKKKSTGDNPSGGNTTGGNKPGGSTPGKPSEGPGVEETVPVPPENPTITEPVPDQGGSPLFGIPALGDDSSDAIPFVFGFSAIAGAILLWVRKRRRRA